MFRHLPEGAAVRLCRICQRSWTSALRALAPDASVYSPLGPPQFEYHLDEAVVAQARLRSSANDVGAFEYGTPLAAYPPPEFVFTAIEAHIPGQ